MYKYLENYKRRVLFGLRYETLFFKNFRLMQERKESELRERAFSGWKY
jgi:hypothetical protein